jgi:hypothetical protein
MERLVDKTPINTQPEKQPGRWLQRGRKIIVQESETPAQIDGIQVFQPGK